MSRIFNAASGLRPTGWAFSRTASDRSGTLTTTDVSTFIGSNGLLQRGTLNAERLDYTPGGVLRGLLIEPSCINYCDGGYATNGKSNLGNGNQPDPFGANFAVQMGPGGYNYQFFNFPAGNVEFSAYGKLTTGAGGQDFRIGSDRANTYADYFPDTGSITYTGPSSTGLIEAGPNGFTRFSFIGNMAAANNPIVIVNNAGTANLPWALLCAQVPAVAKAERATAIISDGLTSNVTRGADTASFVLAAGATALTFTFDDGTTQTISGLTGGSTYTVPVTLTRSRVMYIDDNVASGGASYALAAAAGAYALTGRAATFNRLYRLAAAAGSIVLTGRSAAQSLRRGASPAAFTLTGRSASKAQIRPATPASFALTGGQTSTARARSLLAGVGLFALTGGSARQAQTRSASPGSLTVTGQPIAQGHIFTLACSGGSVAVTGRAAARSLGRFGSVATFTVTGVASAKAVGRLTSGSTRTVTGGASSRGLGRSAAPAAFTLIRPSASRALNLAAPSTATGAVTGRPTSFANGRFASPGAFVLSGVAAGLRSLRGLAAGPGTFGLTGFASGYTNSHVSGYTLGAASGQYTVAMYGDGSAKHLPFMKRKRTRFGLSP